MSVHLEMQIEELEEELVAIKAINQKIQLEKNALKEQFSLQGVSQQRELLKAYEMFVNKDAYNKLEYPINKIIEKFLAFNCG